MFGQASGGKPMTGDAAAAGGWEQARHWLDWAARTAVAIVVTYVFVVVLLVATAQQKIDDALTKEAVGYDYNVAVRYYFGRESLKNVVAENSTAIKQATAQLREANDRIQFANQAVAAQAGDLADDLQRLSAAGCPTPAAPDAAPTPAELVSMAVATQHCAAERGKANPAIPPIATDVLAGQRAVQKSLDDAAGLKRDADDIQDRLDLLQAERNTIDKQLETAARSGDIIAVLKVFEDSPWPLAAQLVYVPPALTGIILASVSGLFGALLITLILFVYPDNRYKFTRTKSYYGRILLGGLIALGVFVLMFSGVAVLAGPNASGSAQNLIAYGGIGILAGMFSDQAAGWLSDRSVFKPEEKDGDATPAGAPGP
jgi:ferritin-like protein